MKKCDCLDICGDDPDIYKRKVIPCSNHIKHEKTRQENRIWKLKLEKLCKKHNVKNAKELIEKLC